MFFREWDLWPSDPEETQKKGAIWVFHKAGRLHEAKAPLNLWPDQRWVHSKPFHKVTIFHQPREDLDLLKM